MSGASPQDRERNRQANQRVTFRAPEELIEEVDDLVEDGVYRDRSKAIRHALRRIARVRVDQRPAEGGGGINSVGRR